MPAGRTRRGSGDLEIPVGARLDADASKPACANYTPVQTVQVRINSDKMKQFCS